MTVKAWAVRQWGGAALLTALWLVDCGFSAFGPGHVFFASLHGHHGVGIYRLGDPIPLPAESLETWVPTHRDYRSLSGKSGLDADSLLDVLEHESMRPASLPCHYCSGCPDHERVALVTDRSNGRFELLLDFTVDEAIASHDGRIAGRFSFAAAEFSIRRHISLFVPGDTLGESEPPDLEHLLPPQLSMTFVATPPVVVRKVPPVYPPGALAANIDGVVIVGAVIGGDGSVIRAEVVRSVRGLDDAALAAARQWQFQSPRDCEGHATNAWVEIPIKFTLH